MKKLAFVIPWYGEDIPGGAESAARSMAHHLSDEGMDIEILTTCVREFTADWNEDYHKPGIEVSAGLTVRRFRVRKRNKELFDSINIKLMQGEQVTKKEEKIFVEEIINSPDLYAYIRKRQSDYQAFLFIPYMFGTTYYGILSCPEKSILIPCFHEESYIHMRIYKKAFERVSGVIYMSEPEMVTAHKVFRFRNAHELVIGTGIDTDVSFDENRFRKKYGISDPFILYAGRKDKGKNIDFLIHCFRAYKTMNYVLDLKLVLLGGGRIDIPEEIKNDVIDLGFVDIQDKHDAYAAAAFLCQPSVNESFSIVIMESWLCGRPVLVHKNCDVTKAFVLKADGGLFFSRYREFEACTNYLLSHKEEADAMGRQGREFVLNHFDWRIVTKKIVGFIETAIPE